MSETFTKWWYRHYERIREGHMTVKQAKDEVKPLKENK